MDFVPSGTELSWGQGAGGGAQEIVVSPAPRALPPAPCEFKSTLERCSDGGEVLLIGAEGSHDRMHG
jgi:hypothetical protein